MLINWTLSVHLIPFGNEQSNGAKLQVTFNNASDYRANRL